MSKKVEEAIETLKCMRLYFSDCEVCTDNDCDKNPCDNLKSIYTVLNYIKELEEERELRIHYENRLDNMEQLYVDKDKIRDKIEELNEDNFDEPIYQQIISEKIDLLEELLEEE